MTRPDPTEVMAVVARRGTVLRNVDTDGIRKYKLVDELAVSRSTIDRAIRELEAIGFVERSNDGSYRRTLPGRIALDEYDSFAARIDGLVSSVDVLSLLPVDAPCTAEILEDATVVLAERHSPHAPVSHLSDLINRSTEVYAIAPAVLPQQVTVYHENLTGGNLTARVVVTDAVIERLVSAYGAKLEEALNTGKLALRQSDASLPYSLIVAETADGPEMGLLIYADSGVRGLIRNDDPEAVRWARQQVDDYWESALPLSVPSSDDS